MQILHNSTTTALWHDIIHEAETQCDIQLREEFESYLVFLMMRYTSKPHIIKEIMATEFLAGMDSPRYKKHSILQEVGDKCLIFSGLFPRLAEKRLVQIGYFVKLGQSSYAHISTKRNDLYAGLAEQFVRLMDVLQALRVYSSAYPDLLPLEAYELWHETGSQRGLSVLKQYTNVIPILVGKQQK